MTYNYSIVDEDKLHLVATDEHLQSFDNKDIDYTTSFRIDADTLIIDSLALGDYGCMAPLKLGKTK